MDTKGILSKEFSAQDFAEEQPYAEMLDRYKDMACNYASMENAIAVLSDLRTNASYIYYGKFSRMLEIGKYGNEAKVPSIWEEEIFRLFHPDDLASKHLQELCFFPFCQMPAEKGTDQLLFNKQAAYENQLKRLYVCITSNVLHLCSSLRCFVAGIVSLQPAIV